MKAPHLFSPPSSLLLFFSLRPRQPSSALIPFDSTNGTADGPADKTVDAQANATFSVFSLTGVTENIGGKNANNANRLSTSGWDTGDQEQNAGKYGQFTVTADPGFELDSTASLSQSIGQPARAAPGTVACL